MFGCYFYFMCLQYYNNFTLVISINGCNLLHLQFEITTKTPSNTPASGVALTKFGSTHVLDQLLSQNLHNTPNTAFVTQHRCINAVK